MQFKSMTNWLRITLVLCTYGFFREFRPSEPFVSEFLSGHWRNISADQITQLVYPVGTYSYLALLVVVFLVTDILRYGRFEETFYFRLAYIRLHVSDINH